MGINQAQKVVTTDASLAGWGATRKGRTMNDTWGPLMQFVHINCLELLVVLLALKHLLSFLKGHHVLVRTDITTVEPYINQKGGLCSRHLHMYAQRLIL